MTKRHGDIEAHAASGGANWYASTGVGTDGQTVVLNFIADSEKDVAPIAHGLGIALGITRHAKAKYIGPSQEYYDLSPD